MTGRVNMADPEFEPTDADLAELVQEAFADVRSENLAALAKVRLQIAELRAVAPTPADLRAAAGIEA